MDSKLDTRMMRIAVRLRPRGQHCADGWQEAFAFRHKQTHVSQTTLPVRRALASSGNDMGNDVADGLAGEYNRTFKSRG
eukprot:SAG31_NODE_26292_length_445_cov_0.439306_1_plen_78_part_10